MTTFSEAELRRYARHIILPGVGADGQERLRAASVLVLGAGGLGSPAATYLAAAGVGRLGIVDDDRVEESNLQRQILHATPDVGRRKVESAAERLRALNPEIEVVPYDVRLDASNAFEVLGPWDVVVDGTDNFPTRYLANDATQLLGRPLVHGSVQRFDGQVTVFLPGREAPCYRCLFPVPPAPGTVPSCAEGGVLGVLPGIVGAIQATEAVKLVLGIGDALVGRLLAFDALRMTFSEVRFARDPACPVCGDAPSVTALVDYDAFCGITAG